MNKLYFKGKSWTVLDECIVGNDFWTQVGYKESLIARSHWVQMKEPVKALFKTLDLYKINDLGITFEEFFNSVMNRELVGYLNEHFLENDIYEQRAIYEQSP